MSKYTPNWTLYLILASALSGCHAVNPPPEPTGPELVRSWINPQWPQSTQVYHTTGSSIYLANLNASISSLDRVYGNRPVARIGTPLADKLYHRYGILGRLEDAETALSIIRQVIMQPGATAESYVTLANILTGFHLFSDALAALDHAREMGRNPEQLDNLSREINIALGNYHFSAAGNTGYRGIVATAQEALLQGDFVLASTHFRQAELSYRGTNPYVLAWIQLQQGIAFLRYGDTRTAHHFFDLAHSRIPEYYLATEHLAEAEMLLGNLSTAQLHYQQVSVQTGNPQFHAQLARVHALLGNIAASQQSIALANSGFDRLLASHPQTIGDHAVNFYLSQGQGDRALVLARGNLQNRQNIESWILLANTALAVNERAEACNAWSSAIQSDAHPVEITRLTERMAGLCTHH